MKFKNIIILMIVALVMGTNTGCKKYLDVVPDERPTEKDIFRDVLAAEGFLYSCYAAIPSPRNTSGGIDLMTSDEIATPFEHESASQFPRGNYSASSPVISYWNNLYKGIRQCYMLINGVDATPGLDDATKIRYKAEAKFLIGYYHSLLMKLYGPVIIQNSVADVNTPAKDFPVRNSYDECVDFVVSILDESAKDLPAMPVATSEIGRATSVIAKAVKARLLLYAASPLFNGGGGLASSFYSNFKNLDGKQLISPTFNKEKWKRAADAAKEAIDAAESNGFVLYKNSTYTASSLPSNPVEKDLRFTFVDKNTNEVIWASTVPEDTYSIQYLSGPFVSNAAGGAAAPSLAIVEQFYTKNGLPIDKDPAYNYAGRYGTSTGPNGVTMNLNLDREPRFNAWIAYHNSKYEIIRGATKETVVKFRKNDANGIQNRSTDYSTTGYLNKKGVHPLITQTTLGVNQQYPFPFIRLAELYLDYAEALIEYGNDLSLAKTYIDKVRDRAGIPGVDAAWAPIGGASHQGILRSIVRQERTIELYFEGHRFWDLRRWMAAEPFGLKVKGMNIQGATDPEFFRVTELVFPRSFRVPANYLMPIPQTEINKNEALVQNPGY
ncbi:RagB/SusD family nutrient uptake outer membrane protein [Pedobacter caeni]|uniref:Starch-binding associating with outer membrane n=1 Tax=Pedobacter caeni TaxID=288992 RepID=A0A1M5A4K8_9SPHI|nr:RagB/SusD family nutrient uptake outer membrane protein [Pedobacter caeni]SHF25249.1 Starch-binding associating with outer membrane [Pedobacter caeni]